MSHFGSASDTDDRPPRRRSSDGGLRRLLEPKAVLVALLSVAGMGVTVGRWVDSREHNDGQLTDELQGISRQINDTGGRLTADELDRRYVPREVYEHDILWIKQALARIEEQTKQPVRR